MERVWLWLVASGDRRVSLWSTDWAQDVCHLVDWLTFPGPSVAPDGTRLRKGHKVSQQDLCILILLYTPLLSLSPFLFPLQCQYDLLPPSLAHFSPSDSDIVVYTGYGLEKCVQFYSISQKTVLRTSALTHWASTMDISPQGHLIAFGCAGTLIYLVQIYLSLF